MSLWPTEEEILKGRVASLEAELKLYQSILSSLKGGEQLVKFVETDPVLKKIRESSDRPPSISFDEYQTTAWKTAIFPGVTTDVTTMDNHPHPQWYYPVLGLCGEAGETAEKFKKIIRDKNSIIDEEDKKQIEKELGDILWYMSAICSLLEMKLSDVAKNNLEKLNSRMERGKLQGSGDDR